ALGRQAHDLGAGVQRRTLALQQALGRHARHQVGRLAKRHGDTRLDTYRARGIPPERIIGLLARWCGIDAEEMNAHQFSERLQLATIPRSPVVMRPEDDVWLMNK
ncbi:MAG TPA: hypothetical protein PLU35_11315, partial [Phycisphaerales bacterium]|nr:hypothetical protein [Phycisphaerales bacterium]